MKKESMIASYRDVASEITRDKDRWAHFLNTAAYMYKYHFADQVMIYGQRQDATMCASFDLWNRLGCWIKSGARGIAIFDANHKSDKIKYVFDVTDTIAKRKAPPKLWKLTRGNAETVSLMLLEEEDIAPSDEKINFRSSLRAAVQSVVEDNYQSYFDQLVQSAQHSALMDLSEQDMQWNFISLLKDSIEYMVQKRCGAANPKLGFRGIEYFNTQRTVNVLGCATSDLARELLIKIERTVKENGRSERNVESDLHAGQGRDSVSRPHDGHESGNADQVRANAQDVPEKPQEQPVHQPADGRDSGQALQGDSGAGRDAQGRDYGEAQETDAPAQDGGLSGGGEVQQPDQRPGRGDRAERDHIQPDELEQTQELPEPVDEISAGSSFSGEITQEDIDHVLLRGSHVEGGRFRIYEQYSRKESNADNIRFLKKEYGIGGGTEYYPDGIRGYADHDGKGIKLQKDNVEEPLQLSWAKVNARLKALVEDGQYLSPDKVAEIPYYHEWHELRQQRARAEQELYHERNRLYHEALKKGAYKLDIGITVYVDGADHQIVDITGDTITLTDPEYPLLQKVKTRAELLEGIADSDRWRNQKLLVVDEPSTIVPDVPFFEEWLAERKTQEQPAEIENDVTTPGEESTDQTPAVAGVTMSVDQVKEYGALKEQYPDHLLGFQVGGDYLFFKDDIEKTSDILGLNAINISISGGEEQYTVKAAGFPANQWQHNLMELWSKGNSVALFELGDDGIGHVQTKVCDGADYIPVGMELQIDDRKFVIVKVNYEFGDVSMQDITFQDAVGFPIFRSEPISFVRQFVEDAPVQAEEPEASVQSQPEKHNYRITDDNYGVAGAKTRFQKNVAAIRMLKAVEGEDRLATPDEQDVIAGYTGWGAIPQAFDEGNASWTNEYAELKALLTEEEHFAARNTTVNGHYTAPIVIKAMYAGLEKLGFRKGSIIDPACGSGNFYGNMPESMSESKIYGVEIDSITSRIARQLYQDVNITTGGYEDTLFDDNFFDVAVGNVPFGTYKVSDARYNKYNFLIHDYFFAKTIDKVRPGGLIAFVTSKGTLDKANSQLRKYIAQRAELIGAIRLPNNAFKANAGTEVTTDIIFLQKRDRAIDILPGWVHLTEPEDGVPINQYFADHPEMILGTMAFDDGMYGNGKDTACLPFEDRELSELLKYAVENLDGQYTEVEFDEELEEPSDDATIPADPRVKNFTYTLHDDEIYYRENSMMHKAEMNETAQERVRGMIGIRQTVREIIDAQMANMPDSDIETLQAVLNSNYDDFTKKYGIINSHGNKRAFKLDADYPLLCSLEVLNEENEFEGKAAFFTRRTIKPHAQIEKVDTADEALIVSMAERGRVDISFMSDLTGTQPAQVVRDLQGVIFREPMSDADDITRGWLPKDEYLSGNVRDKLKLARIKAEGDEMFMVNVEALTEVIPEDIEAADIEVRLGSVWVPADDVRGFILDTLEPAGFYRDRINVQYSPYSSLWSVGNKPYTHGDVLAQETYGTERMDAYHIIETTLNLRAAVVRDKKYDPDGKEYYVVNNEETILAQEKQALLKDKFREWVFDDPQRRERLVRKYNDEYNNLRPREYDGSNLRFYGMNPEISLHEHQRNAIARILYGGNTLLGHEVGAGKTFEIVGAIQESKRLALCNKALVVVPNHLVEQWASEYLRLYPAANILVVSKQDFEKKKRRKFCARIATGEYDAVIMGHSQLEKIPMSASWQENHLREQVDSVMRQIDEAKRNNGEHWTIKQMVATQRRLEAKLKNLTEGTRDDLLKFEELGIDMLVVDESHEFKNLALTTKMRNVAGISQTDAKKSSDLFMKCRYMDVITGARGIVFATGTPISNTLAEMYTNQRYLQYDELRARGVENFDAWASVFAETRTALELAPSGQGYRLKTRLSTFYNLPELCAMFANVADIKVAADLNLPVPKMKGGKPQAILLKPSEMQRAMVTELVERSEAIRGKHVDPSEDNMLKVTTDGRNLALDVRLIDPELPDEQASKVWAACDNIYRIWQEKMEDKATQLVFCDIGTPHSIIQMTKNEHGEYVMNDAQFHDIYNDIKFKLAGMGIPPEEIAFIHEAKTDVQKANLFAKVRSGAVRVLMGSTAKMGAGTNVQDRLYALHHLDVPWRPSDLQQREGRIIRPGNMYDEVEVFRYVKEQTFDSYNFQIIENKQKFISQIMTNKAPSRRMDDLDDMTLNYAEVKALASGNPLIREKMDLDLDVARLELLRNKHKSQQFRLQDMVSRTLPHGISTNKSLIESYNKDISEVTKHEGKDFTIQIGGADYTDKEKAGTVLLALCPLAAKSDKPYPVGQYLHFDLSMEANIFTKEVTLTLKGNHSYSIELSKSETGNITRIENVAKGIGKLIDKCNEKIVDLEKQIDKAKLELEKPFPQEDELVEKKQRVARLNVELDLDKKEPEVVMKDEDEVAELDTEAVSEEEHEYECAR